MKPINLFGLGVQSKSNNVTSQKRINLYLEFTRENDKTTVVAYGTPGLVLFADRGDDPIRGMHAFGSYIYIVHRGTLWRIDSLGTAVSKGTLNTISGKVSMADNGTQIMIATGASGYIYNTVSDAFALISKFLHSFNIYARNFCCGRIKFIPHLSQFRGAIPS